MSIDYHSLCGISIDFKDKIVWDIGSNAGFFLRYAMERGAKRAVGFDLKDQNEAAFHIGNHLGYFNIDYLYTDLSNEMEMGKLPKPDITFFLSMNFHVRIPKLMLEQSDMIIFEDNGKESRKKRALSLRQRQKI